MKHAREDYNVIQDTTAARKLADLVLSMNMTTDKGLVARHLAREVLGITDAGRAPAMNPITTNGTTRLIPNDEPVFLLRGQDRHASATVRYWAALVESDGGKSDIVIVAREHADKMDSWPKKKLPDLAVPKETEELLNAALASQQQSAEPFDADDPRFREVFEIAIKNLNYPLVRKGNGYRSPYTQSCLEVAFEVVNRMKLYTSPPSTSAAVEAALRKAADVCSSRQRRISNGNGLSYQSTDAASIEAGYCAEAIIALIPQPSTISTDYVQKDKVREMMLDAGKSVRFVQSREGSGLVTAELIADPITDSAIGDIVDRILTEHGVK
jgi:hypothetical protein